MPIQLNPDMRAVIESAHLVFAATVTPDGRPNVSPKGTIRVFDAARLFFLDIASPRTRENLRRNPAIELNVIDQISRRGYRFSGRASLHAGDDIFAAATARVFAEEGAEYPVACVVLIEPDRAEPLVSPGYLNIPDERAMRTAWARRRAELDAAFEAHLRTRPPWTRETRG
jgi:general stress protein 26